MATHKTPKPQRRYVRQWDALKPSTRRRYISRLGGSGDGAAQRARARYLSGENLAAARGHNLTPEHPGRQLPWVARARAYDIRTYVPDFDTLPRQTQNEISQWYVRGHFMRGQGALLSDEEIKVKKQWGTWQPGREYRHWSREQEEDKIQWENFIERHYRKVWQDKDLDLYRDNKYFSTFSSSTRSAA